MIKWQYIRDVAETAINFTVLKTKVMITNTQRNDGQQSVVSQQKHLSFYEENYILEPEDYEKDNGYFEYESQDTLEVLNFSRYQLAI